MRLVAYLRVSTDRQADEGQGLEVQELACRGWIRRGRHRLVAVERDEGLSGAADAANRPALARSLALVAAGRADGLLVYRLDRLARDLVLQEQLLSEVRRLGGALRSTSPAEDQAVLFDPDDPTRALVRRILGAIAEYERDMIRLRMRAGKAAKASRGGYIHGRPPYGWRAVDHQLVPDVEEQRVIRDIRRMRREGLSLRTIAIRLDQRGIRPRYGEIWQPRTLARILERPVSRGPLAPVRPLR